MPEFVNADPKLSPAPPDQGNNFPWIKKRDIDSFHTDFAWNYRDWNVHSYHTDFKFTLQSGPDGQYQNLNLAERGLGLFIGNFNAPYFKGMGAAEIEETMTECGRKMEDSDKVNALIHEELVNPMHPFRWAVDRVLFQTEGESSEKTDPAPAQKGSLKARITSAIGTRLTSLTGTVRKNKKYLINFYCIQIADYQCISLRFQVFP